MTEKQEKILTTALALFAENGYDGTSTSKVAKEAGVSEGLIFRHFKNKEGLLAAIMELGKEKATQMFAEVLTLTDPQQRLEGIISLPFQTDDSNYHFWKLVYALKWQADIYDDSMSVPVKEALLDIFKSLKYENPKAETEAVLLLLDGISTAVLLRKPKNQKQILQAILNKYKR